MQPISIQGYNNTSKLRCCMMHRACVEHSGHIAGTLLADITPPPPCPFLQARPKTGVSGTKVAAPGFSSSFTLTGFHLPSFLIGTLSLCLPAPARALPDKWEGEWEQTNDEQPVWPPIALIGVTLSGCPAPMAIITMILVKITVPFMIETLITMMRTWTCDRMA